jgi:hypothetical protein
MHMLAPTSSYFDHLLYPFICYILSRKSNLIELAVGTTT